MNLSNERVIVKNTYEINQIIDEMLIKNPRDKMKLANIFIFCDINGLKLLIEPQKIYYISQIFNINPIKFSHSYIMGYDRFNHSFYTIIDLEQFIFNNDEKQQKQKLNNNANCLIYLNNNNAIHTQSIRLLKKDGLKQIDNDMSKHVEKINKILMTICSNLYIDPQQNYYYVLDSDKLDSIL